MALTLLNNVASLNAQDNLGRTQMSLNQSLERLSSGLKINRGADGPAALVISEEQRAQIVGLQTAISNTSKGVDVVQTAEGALNEINALLTKMRGLALDSANSGVNDNPALAANQQEITNALSTIDRIAQNTQFGQKHLLDGSSGFYATTTSPSFQSVSASSATLTGAYTITTTQNAQKGNVGVVDAGNLDNVTNLAQDETLTITPAGGSATVINLKTGMTNAQVAAAINGVTAQTGVVASLNSGNGALVLDTQNFGQNFTITSSVAAATAGSTGIGNVAINTGTGAGPANVTVTQGQNVVANVSNGATVQNGVVGNGNTITFVNGPFTGLNMVFATDPASNGLATLAAAAQHINVSDNSLTFQIGANAGQTAAIAVDNSQSSSLGTGVANVQFASLSQINISTNSGAQDAIKVIDAAISQVSNLRGKLGAFQANTLEATANNLQTTLENTTSAEATIRDTNFAEETANFTKNQVLLQAGATVLNNANQTSQLVLSLLQGR